MANATFNANVYLFVKFNIQCEFFILSIGKLCMEYLGMFNKVSYNKKVMGDYIFLNTRICSTLFKFI